MFRKIIISAAVVLAFTVILLLIFFRTQPAPDQAVVLTAEKEIPLPRYSLLPPEAAFPVTVEATGGAFVRVNRLGERAVFDGQLEAVEAEYLEASPGAKLKISLPGVQVIVSENTGVSLTRLRSDDVMLTLATGEVTINGTSPARLSVQAGDLITEITKDQAIGLILSKEEDTRVIVSEGAVKSAYVDGENETRVKEIKQGEMGEYKNKELRIK